MEKAERGDRAMARGIDAFLFVFPVMPLGLAPLFPNIPAKVFGLGFLFAALWALAVFSYQSWLLGSTGQTLGKRMLRLRVVDAATREHPGFARAVAMRSWLNALLGFVPLYAVVDILFIFRDDGRCVHDHLAGTTVVKLTP